MLGNKSENWFSRFLCPTEEQLLKNSTATAFPTNHPSLNENTSVSSKSEVSGSFWRKSVLKIALSVEFTNEMGLIFECAFWDAAAILSVVAALVYYYITSTQTFWEQLNVPYIKPEFFYGNIKQVTQFKKNQAEVFSEFYNHFKQTGHKFGGIFQMRDPVLLVCCPELARDIFIKNFPHFHDRSFVHDENFDPLSAHLVALEGQKWKYLRSKLSPAFSTSKLKGMLHLVREIAEDYMKTLEETAVKKEMLELRKSFSLYFTDLIGAVAFGLRVNAQKEESEFLHMGKQYFEPTRRVRILQIILSSYPWLYKTFRIKTIPKRVTEFFMGVVKDTMEHRRKNNIHQNDFLHFLMKIKEEKGASLEELEEMKGVANYNTKVNEDSIVLTEGVIAAQAFVFFLAGYETSSSALSTCIHVLAHYPKIQENIFQEVKQITEKFGDLTYEAIQNLIYVEQVIEETLRMYPPVGLIIRKCTKPYPIPGTNIIIPEGCKTFIPIYSFHHDPEFFPNPEEFKPERFSPENRANLVPYSFMPFGHGPRVCIGSRLAMMEMKLSLALMVKNFEVFKCEKTKPYRLDPKSFFLSPMDGLWVRLSKRKTL